MWMYLAEHKLIRHAHELEKLFHEEEWSGTTDGDDATVRTNGMYMAWNHHRGINGIDISAAMLASGLTTKWERWFWGGGFGKWQHGCWGPRWAVVNVGTTSFMVQSLGVSVLYFVKILPLPIKCHGWIINKLSDITITNFAKCRLL